jgi:hypothetical protein
MREALERLRVLGEDHEVWCAPQETWLPGWAGTLKHSVTGSSCILPRREGDHALSRLTWAVVRWSLNEGSIALQVDPGSGLMWVFFGFREDLWRAIAADISLFLFRRSKLCSTLHCL